MHGHIPVLSQCWEGLCGSLAKEEWQGNDGRRGSERASYHLICGAWVGGLEGREIIKMPRVKAILPLEPISLRNCLPESVFMPPALHYKAADSRVWRLLFTWAHVGLNCGSNRFHLEVIRDISGSQWLWLGHKLTFSLLTAVWGWRVPLTIRSKPRTDEVIFFSFMLQPNKVFLWAIFVPPKD